MMEPLSPVYPHLDDVRTEKQETDAQPPETERSAGPMYPSLPPDEANPSHQASTSSDPSVGSTSDPSQPRTYFHQLYSPTKFELESHPVRQRITCARDDIVTGLGSAPEEPQPAFSDSSRQAQQGSERLFDAMADAPNVKEGDKVHDPSYPSNPGGTVTQVATEGSVTMETKRGNEVKRDAEPGNPALYIERTGHDQVKKASDVEVDKPGSGHNEGPPQQKEAPKEEKKTENGEPQTGEKRAAEESAEDKKDEEDGDAKKQKTDEEPKENGEKPKKKGRPAKKDSNDQAAPKKETKKKAPKKAATESGEPRRSGRQASKSN